MPDLGPYAANVLGAYAVGILLLVVLTVWSLLRAARVKKKLSELEHRRQSDG